MAPSEDQTKTEVDDVTALATLLTATPKLRAKLLANPTTEVGKQLPAPDYWTYSRDEGMRARERAELAKDVLLAIAASVKNGELSSTVNTDSVFEDYFTPIVRASERSFATTFRLSIGLFLTGLALIGSGVYIAITSPAGTNSTIVASIFGGSGAVSALGSVFALATSGIRDATRDHARLWVTLTGFATELGQLRALAEVDREPTRESVSDINAEIRMAMERAVQDLYSTTDQPSQPAVPTEQ